MKYITRFSILLWILPLFFISCGESGVENPQKYILLIGERDEGIIYTMDSESGDTIAWTEFSLNTETVTGIRGMAYNSNTNRIYAGQNTNAGGQIFEIMATKSSAVLFNDNDDGTGNMEWYGIADLTIGSDSLIYATTWDMDIGDPVIIGFNSDGTRAITIEFGAGGPCCGLGLTTMGEDFIVGDYQEFNIVDSEGNILSTVTLSGTFTPALDLSETFVQNLTWVGDELYALIYDNTNSNSFVAKLNTTSGELTQVSAAYSGRYQGLAAVPDVAFR